MIKIRRGEEPTQDIKPKLYSKSKEFCDFETPSPVISNSIW